MHYVDSSAVVKLVVTEAHTPAVIAWWQSARPFTSALTFTEVVRVAGRHSAAAVTTAVSLLAHIPQVDIDRSVVRAAARLGSPELRSLDAIHLATAQLVAADVEAVVTYDARMAAAATAMGFPVIAPS